MAFNLVVSKKAKIDLADSIEFYNQKQQGLGKRFLRSTISYFSLIQQKPELFSLKRGPFREAYIREFPFIIIYAINFEKNEIIVHRVFHTSQSPEKKP